MKKKMSRSTLVLILVFLAGLSLLLYPSVSNYWNSFHATQAIVNYAETVENLDQEEYTRMLADAQAYNQSLLQEANRFHLTDAQRAEYESLLDVSGTGIMGYIEIDAIDVSLPIYHTVDESVLQVAAGHMEGSSLPVGGPTTHCILTGHRGLPSAQLFTHLDKLAEGDVFTLNILNETLTYQVDQISIVEPTDLSDLQIQEGEDLCTLVTCTPYGINTHRLLVRGHRVENLDPAFIQVTAEALPIDPILVAPLVAAPILVALLGLVLVKSRKT